MSVPHGPLLFCPLLSPSLTCLTIARGLPLPHPKAQNDLDPPSRSASPSPSSAATIPTCRGAVSSPFSLVPLTPPGPAGAPPRDKSDPPLLSIRPQGGWQEGAGSRRPLPFPLACLLPKAPPLPHCSGNRGNPPPGRREAACGALGWRGLSARLRLPGRHTSPGAQGSNGHRLQRQRRLPLAPCGCHQGRPHHKEAGPPLPLQGPSPLTPLRSAFLPFALSPQASAVATLFRRSAGEAFKGTQGVRPC